MSRMYSHPSRGNASSGADVSAVFSSLNELVCSSLQVLSEVFMVSDDNAKAYQKTLLVYFELLAQ